MSEMYSGPSAGQIADAVRREIQGELDRIQYAISVTNDNVQVVEGRVDTVDDKVEELRSELLSFVREQRMANRLNQAETRIGTIRQELEKKYGHYDIVRRSVIGILEATDLALVRQSTISTASENLFISTPHYWLAPCLVALAAWINDNQPLAEKAVKEAMKRNAENSSLFFALITRRADRFQPSLLWVQNYLATQNEEDLNRNALVILDALVCGLWGHDTEGVISAQFKSWIDKLESRDNFYEDQVEHWKTAFLNMRRSADHGYPHLAKYATNWSALDSIMNGANLHATVYKYIKNIFDEKIIMPDFKTMLDETLTRLVTNYDDEELPLRERERLESLVIEYRGDEKRAQAHMDSEKELFAVRKNFMQLLLEAAMNPEQHDVNRAVTKFAIAVSKYYIYDAYNDIAAENRSKIPEKFKLKFEARNLSLQGVQSACNLSEFKFNSVDGSNEISLLDALENKVNEDKETALKTAEQWFEANKPKLWFYITICVLISLVCLLAAPVGIAIAIVCIIIAIYLYRTNTVKFKKNYSDTIIPNIKKGYDEALNAEKQAVRACCAEVVDFKEEFGEKDKVAQQFLDYIDTLEGNEYIHVPVSRKQETI